MAVSLPENIDWVGYVDAEIRDFHGYDAARGSTYNAYLVRDERTALIDAVRAPYAEQLLAAVAARCDPAQVAYVVCNHAEPDHSGALPRVMQALGGATLLCDARCRAALAQHYDLAGWKVQTVADGQTVPLGRRTLRFIETPMAHWPESMFTYVPEERLLFSMDVFGQHYATTERFDEEVPAEVLFEEAKTYYANILMPYGAAVGKSLAKLAGVALAIIAPSHGVIWRRDAARILAAYGDWVAQRPAAKVLVLYDTMWESTAAMAEAIAAGAAAAGVQPRLFHLRHTSLTQLAAEVLDAAAVAFGSPTLNRGLMPAAAAALSYFAGLRPQGKAAVAFGSYGWGPGGPEAVQHALQSLGWELLRDPIRAQYRPTAAVLAECRHAGEQLAETAKGKAEGGGRKAEG
ncbi:MAG: FprA family A-type flavoprotein [Thermoguttaceae bacterium]